MDNLSKFTNLYSLSKTLRFELIPQGKTLTHIQEKGLLSQDERRADSYKKVKKIIDEYHKAFIKESLANCKLNEELLAEYLSLYNVRQRGEDQKKKFEEIQTKLRKEIADKFTKSADYSKVSKEGEGIKAVLEAVKDDADKKKLLEEFNRFSTYFGGFYENRKNMYSAEDKATAISYRLIHENLPKFIDNIAIFEKIKNSPVADNFEKLYTNLEEYLNVSKIEDIFNLETFSDFLTQEQIDVYNSVIGGKTEEDGKKKQGLNEYINLHNQQQTDKTKKLPKLKPFFKQILNDRNAISWLPEEFERGKDNFVLESIEKCYQELCKQVFAPEEKQALIGLLYNLNDYDSSKIYLRNDTTLTDISQQLFGSWAVIQKAVEMRYENENPRKKNKKGKFTETEEKFAERKENFFKHHDSFSIGYLNECLALLGDMEKDEKVCTKNIADYFTNLGKKGGVENLFVQISTNYEQIKTLLNTPYPEDKDLAQDKISVEKIKLFLDSIKAVQWFVKPLLGKNESNKDERFYGEFTPLWEELDKITPLYNKVRNYMTQKPYSIEKIKLNFENSTLLNGWDKNKEQDNTAVLLRKGGNYYLAIMNYQSKIKFDEIETAKDDKNFYEKIEYKLLPGPNKMLPKVFFSKKGKAEFNPSDKILNDYENGCHKIGATFDKAKMHEIIDFFKTSIVKHKDWKKFGFNFSSTATYDSIDKFYNEVSEQGYKITLRNIPESAIHQLVEEGNLYLFQIYNKDFSEYSKGTPNMHTLYWRELFSEENLKNVVYKLNGEAEVFYRKSSIKDENIIVHKAKKNIQNKNEQNQKKESCFEYDIIKDKRYTVDKFSFHVPITMNFKAEGTENINPEVNQFIKENPEDIHIIGIDRGERHLLYLSLINSKGVIVKQFSLNEIVNEHNGNKCKTNYHTLLDTREKERQNERESWKTIESIKELKEGYISQVIHKISELMVEYTAIVVLEDLNMGFMRGRQKVEKSVYQKFEKMLIDKLNYLVNKKKQANELGGTLQALQLTNKFVSFKKLGKQSGFLFYVPAWNTSKMCPVTGFVNLFDTRYENVEKTKTFFSKFDSIKYNNDKNYFEFDVKDYSKFSGKAEDTRLDWLICTHGKRIESFRNPEKNSQWDNREIDLTSEFKKILGTENSDLKEFISQQTEKLFFERLLYLFAMTVKIRNSITNSDMDYIISPVTDENGKFYDSRNGDETLPENGDANGAYNIARKGLWIVEQIQKTENFMRINLAISNKEWLQFTQNPNHKK
ncbi:MAG: type V CRISPR-associated protein Cas12a/Cpf1 [Tannerella sp.]|jgi:CRISPR-associated protein Cpf1|nr:type V CRISPR-associated protein Cas12a/Cpf1 [Tannerella sp.]